MEHASLRLYPETSIQFDKSLQALHIHCPWMTLKFRVLPENAPRIESAVKRIAKTKTSPEDQAEINWLLAHFNQYPVLMPQPRLALAPTASQEALSQGLANIARMNFNDLLTYIAPDLAMPLGHQPDWIWDADEILNLSSINEDLYDPMTIYALCRRRRLLSEHETAANHQWYTKLDELRETNEEAFFRLAILAIRQTHFVTSQCVSSLSPALNTFTEATSEITAFMKEEAGHDRLVLMSLKGLGISQPEEHELLNETLLSIKTLRFSAENCPLGFACLIGIFEGTTYSANDPMSDILKKSSKPSAAKGLQTHFLINRDHNHSNVGAELSATLGSVNRDHALSAIRLSELTVRLGNLLTTQLMKRINECLRSPHGAA